MKKINGWWLHDDENDKWYNTWSIEKGDYQDYIVPYLHQYVKEKKVALDIGANYGAVSHGLAKEFETVHAFEINPEFIEPLQKNLEGCDNVIIHNVGLGEANRKVKYDHKSSGGRSRVYLKSDGALSKNLGWIRKFENKHGHLEHCKDMELEVKKLDDYEFDRVDLIKIDVECMEPLVIFGALETIKKHKPVIVSEALVDFQKDLLCFLLQDCLGYVRQQSKNRDHTWTPPQND
jgi:FkbM family methyltransferase